MDHASASRSRRRANLSKAILARLRQGRIDRPARRKPMSALLQALDEATAAIGMAARTGAIRMAIVWAPEARRAIDGISKAIRGGVRGGGGLGGGAGVVTGGAGGAASTTRTAEADAEKPSLEAMTVIV